MGFVQVENCQLYVTWCKLTGHAWKFALAWKFAASQPNIPFSDNLSAADIISRPKGFIY